MSTIDEHLAENLEIEENFLSLNQGLIHELQQRFIDYHESRDLFARYLMCKVLLEIVAVEGAASKALLRQEIMDRGIFMGDPVEC